eukprot:CAMPEP_0172325416 /NCGR_PEP_ID=MMETSP1058-20130122/53971_1 /TAXON_ID=83371 /ORGANISM="Detonula confervacea, Strain CCMP 353" /LENGTH=493 /DNA_ID=CAMNT_0013041955 /DNA_START=202 /DNA_END=1683 /DNA_ORIENTATION=-
MCAEDEEKGRLLERGGPSKVIPLSCKVNAQARSKPDLIIMCAEDDDDDDEHDRLLEIGSPSKAYTRQQASITPNWKKYVYLFAFAATAFIVGCIGGIFLLHEKNDMDVTPDNTDMDVTLDNIDMDVTPDNVVTLDNVTLASPLYNATFVDYLTHGMEVILARNNGTKKQYIYDSPYEQRWPDEVYKQPYWSRKSIPYNKNIPGDKQLCFVHVGKAGGSTVGCLLGFSLHCDSSNDISGLLPIVTTHAFHRGVNDCQDGDGYYLFVVRDPLARILSAINYERPNMTEAEPFDKGYKTKELYQDCGFWTLEDLAQKGLIAPSSKKCRGRAINAVTGEGTYLIHGYFNYQYYAQFAFGTEDNNDASAIPENANILVIRNKHMVQDWNSIEEFLGGGHDVLQPSDIPVNNAHAKNLTELYLSDDSKIALCQVLCNEIQVYKDIIKRAINFNGDDVQQSMEELLQTCPKETMDSTCGEHRPSMRHKIEGKKGVDNHHH